MLEENKVEFHNVERSGLETIQIDELKYILVLFGYLFVCGFIIPVILLKYKQLTILEGYMPNLDLIACSLGYSEGPYGLFKHLYNPSTESSIGILSSQILNYTALLGTTFIISYYTHKTKSIIHGWSRAFIMLLATYLVPGYFLAYFSFMVGDRIKSYLPLGSFTNWFATVVLSLIMVFLIISVEGLLIEIFAPKISSFLTIINQMIQQF